MTTTGHLPLGCTQDQVSNKAGQLQDEVRGKSAVTSWCQRRRASRGSTGHYEAG